MPISINTKNEMKIIYFWKPLLWLAIIIYALFIPAKDLPIKPFLNIPHFDKMVHFSLFFVFCILLLKPLKKLQLKYYIIAPVFSIILSGLLEFSQHPLSHTRTSDYHDFIANSTGVIAATVFYYLFVSNRKWEKLF